jgi:hypothetical protein
MTKNKSKTLIRKEEEHKWYDKKINEMEKERQFDRSWDAKEVLTRMKKIKLALKESIEKIKNG